MDMEVGYELRLKNTRDHIESSFIRLREWETDIKRVTRGIRVEMRGRLKSFLSERTERKD